MAAKGQTLKEFGNLYPAESKLLAACRDGTVAEIDNSRPEARTPENHVRADFIRFLARGGAADAPVHEIGVNLRGAVVVGELNLAGVRVPYPLRLLDCRFQTDDGQLADLIFSGARLASGLSLMGSQVQGIDGNGLRARGDIELSGGFQAAAEVLLLNAQIEGIFQCEGGHFGAVEGDALSFDGAKISGSVFLNGGFEATGEVRFLGATIGGNLECLGAKLTPVEGYALSFDGAKISGSVFLNGGFEATGAVQFLGATIRGTLDCSRAKLAPKEGDALSFDRARILGSVFLNGGFEATCQVRFVGAEIGGNLQCSGAKLTPKEGNALSFDGAKISGDVFLNDRVEATGVVRFLGVEIGGNLSCSGAKLTPTKGGALSFDGAKISGGVFLNDSFEATGEVRFAGATIGGNLQCSGAKLTPKEGYALSFDGARVSGDVFLNDSVDATGEVRSFEATGTVRFLGATIGGDLDCSGAKLTPKEGYALVLERSKIAGSIYLTYGFHSKKEVGLDSAEIGASLDLSGATIAGEFDAQHAIVQHAFKLTEMPQTLSDANLRHMQCGSLQDDAASWGRGNHLNGFTYRSLAHEAPIEPGFRVKWLKAQSPDSGTYRPQPWRHLQKTLKAMGHDAEAREIGIAHEKERRRRGVIGAAPVNAGCAARLYERVARTFHHGYGIFTDYGYKPLKLLAWMAGVWLVCAFIFWRAALGGIMGPTSPLVFQNEEKYKTCSYWANPEKEDPRKPTLFFVRKAYNWYFCEELPSDYTTFSPIMYSLDLLLPVVDLFQDKDWGVQIPTPKDDVIEELVSAPWQYLVRLVVWLEILFGWMASLMLVAVISGMARNTRDDE